MRKHTYTLLYIICAFIIVITLTLISVATGFFDTWFGNKVEFQNKKIEEVTDYDTIKKVEDTCRSMIASYESDCLTYEQYKDSDNEEKQSWAEQAKMRANKTASSYNNYILENSFVWQDNVPDDINIELEYLK